VIRINLLPVREARRKADLRQQFLMIAAAAVGSLVLVTGFHQFVRSSVANTNKRVEALKVQLAQFKPQQEQVDAYKAKKSDIEQKLEVIDRLEKSRSGPVHILDELASRTPERVWLTSLSATDGKIELEGMSLDNELVALFLTALNDSPYFANVELKETELKTVDQLKLNTFKIVAQLESPDAPAPANQAPPALKGKGNKAGKPAAARTKPTAGKES
jgi:type IV pilus assembly protein PilN